ncbi:hypothetical protein WBG78_30530 [Chryseolinea sp. T2]|uniref:hypothetical protein n=1 Tax=Chryseolinea sp. T2 TaxID=3129255 RepID=UPI0030771E17
MKAWIIAIMMLVTSNQFAFSQNTLLVKLSKKQSDSFRASNVGNRLSASFGEVSIDNFFAKYKLRNIVQAFPEARAFNHALKERILLYYRVDIDYPINELKDEFIASGLFEIVEVEETPKLLAVPNDFGVQDPVANAPHNNQWYLTNIKAQQAWDVSIGSPSIKIAVSDNGFLQTHDELVYKVLYAAPSLPIQAHGTGTAVIAAGATNNGVGLSSIGYNCSLMLYNMTVATMGY